MSSDATDARARLSSTSFAVLGLLCLRPWSAYELAGQMQRGWDDVWPRAVRGIYDEPKKLVDAGFATARQEATGARPRTVYEATEAGRVALADWLTRPPAPPKLEAEALVKVLLGEQGSKDDLLAAIASVVEYARDHGHALHKMGVDYISTGGPFPDRQHVLHLVGGFLAEYHAALLRWATWAHREVEAWGGVDRPQEVPDMQRLADAVRRRFEDNLARAEEFLAAAVEGEQADGS